MLKYSHPWLALLLHYWPAAIMLPMILLLIVVLALITRWWDRRDRGADPRAGAARAPGGRAPELATDAAVQRA